MSIKKVELVAHGTTGQNDLLFFSTKASDHIEQRIGVLDIRDPHESAVVVGGVVDIAGAEVERRHSVEVHKFVEHLEVVSLDQVFGNR